MSILDRIRRVDFPRAQYAQVAHPKRQIVLHHTVSGVGIDGDIATWLGNSARIATCLIIHHDGTPWQCFSSRYWAHHLGCKRALFRAQGFDAVESRNPRLNQQSIAIEIDSAGGLTQRDGAWYSSFGRRIPTDRVQVYADGYRGFHGFEKYTEEQLRSVEELLRWWQAERYPDIPLAYRPTMWDVEHDALAGEPGVYSHTSFRPDKSDCHPQPELIEMLRGLEGEEMCKTKSLRLSAQAGAKLTVSGGSSTHSGGFSVWLLRDEPESMTNARPAWEGGEVTESQPITQRAVFVIRVKADSKNPDEARCYSYEARTSADGARKTGTARIPKNKSIGEATITVTV